MPSADPSLTVTPVETAGWLLAARPWAVAHGLLWPSVDQIFAATRANRAHAQAIADAIIAAQPALQPARCAEAAVARGLRLDAHEAEPITEALIRERLAARDRFLTSLVLERDAILAACGTDVSATLIALVDRLASAEHTIDRHVWLDAAADLVAPLAHDERIALAQRAARRIHTAFRISPHDRSRLERALLRRLWPLE